MGDELSLTYAEMRRLLEGPTGDQAMRYAFWRYAQGHIARYLFRGKQTVLRGPEAVCYFAISDFLDLCFAGHVPDIIAD